MKSATIGVHLQQSVCEFHTVDSQAVPDFSALISPHSGFWSPFTPT